jgi:hypothetical protein
MVTFHLSSTTPVRNKSAAVRTEQCRVSEVIARTIEDKVHVEKTLFETTVPQSTFLTSFRSLSWNRTEKRKADFCVRTGPRNVSFAWALMFGHFDALRI